MVDFPSPPRLPGLPGGNLLAKVSDLLTNLQGTGNLDPLGIGQPEGGDDALITPLLPPGGDPQNLHGGLPLAPGNPASPHGEVPLPPGSPAIPNGDPALPHGEPALPPGSWMPPAGSQIPQGMQNVFPNIAQQVGTLQIGTTLVPPTLGTLVAGEVKLAALPTAAPVLPGTPPGQAPLVAAPQVTAAQTPLGTPQTSTARPIATNMANGQVGTAMPANPSAVPASRGAGENVPLAASRPGDAAMPPRAENLPWLARLAAALQIGALTPPAAPVATPPPGATQPINVTGLTVGPMAIPPTDARGAILPANDNAAMRRDLGPIVIAGHTLEGTQRRLTRQRAYLMSRGFNRWLRALGGTGIQMAAEEEQMEREVERVFQWLFWVLAIVAYGCLAATVVALIAGRGGLPDDVANTRHAGGFAILGLLAGAAAWWLARRLMRRSD